MKPLPATRSPDMSKVYKLRSEEVEMIRETLMSFVVEKKVMMKESDLIHALIRYKLEELKSDDVLRYRESILGKDD